MKIMKRFLKAVWEFVSFLFVPRQGRHITEQAQSYASDDDKVKL